MIKAYPPVPVRPSGSSGVAAGGARGGGSELRGGRRGPLLGLRGRARTSAEVGHHLLGRYLLPPTTYHKLLGSCHLPCLLLPVTYAR